jgi:DNA-binding winged helix-turn-helix (wHTH) protein
MNVLVIKTGAILSCSSEEVCVLEQGGSRDVFAAIEKLSPCAVLFVGALRPDPIEWIAVLRSRKARSEFAIAVIRSEDELPCLSDSACTVGRKLLSLTKGLVRKDQLPEQKASRTLYVDPRAREVSRGGARITCSPTEFRLLVFMLRYPDVIFSREELLNRACPNGHPVDSRMVDVLVRRIRSKMEMVLEAPEYLRTARGLGYEFSRGHDIFIDRTTGHPVASWQLSLL